MDPIYNATGELLDLGALYLGFGVLMDYIGFYIGLNEAHSNQKSLPGIC